MVKGNKRCKECNNLKSQFYKHKSGDLYSEWIDRFNKKQNVNTVIVNTTKHFHFHRNTQNRIIHKNFIQNTNTNHTNNIDEIDTSDDTNNTIDNTLNRTIHIGPSICGKTYLLFSIMKLVRWDNPKQQMITKPLQDETETYH